MPNHIQSKVEIKGSKEKIAKLVKDLGADENKFDFNGIIKMPPELAVESGSITDLGMIAHSQERYETSYIANKAPWWKERYPNVTNAKELKEFLENSDNDSDKQALKNGKIALDNITKHGFKDWYEWSISNWGTKWNAYDVQYIAKDDTKIVVEITTAWDTPTEIWTALESQGFEVNGIYYGEMEGHGEIGEPYDMFGVSTQVEYYG